MNAQLNAVFEEPAHLWPSRLPAIPIETELGKKTWDKLEVVQTVSWCYSDGPSEDTKI